MSRVIVKGLPKRISQEELSTKFSDFGAVTDCQLKFTKEGVFRRFAFVGFKQKDAAAKSVESMNGSFLNTSRVTVEICRPLGDADKPRAWSKYATDSSAYLQLHGSDVKKEVDIKKEECEDVEVKVEVEESVSAPQMTHLAVGGTVEAAPDVDAAAFLKEVDLAQIVARCNNDRTALCVFRLPKTVKVKQFRSFFAPVRLRSLTVSKSNGVNFALLFLNRTADAALILKRQGEFFGGQKLNIYSVAQLEQMSKKKKRKKQSASDGTGEAGESAELDERARVAQVAENGRIYARNLPYSCTEDDLQALFAEFGPLAEIVMPVDKTTLKPKGYALITYVLPENAVSAYIKLDGAVFQGRMLHLIPGTDKPQQSGTGPEGAAGSFKNAKRAELRKKAPVMTHTWNALFLGTNTVADAFAKRLSTSKASVMDVNAAGGELGVRMALGESQLVRETRSFLEENGVVLDSFTKSGERSKIVILVKNLPSSTSMDEMKTLFGRCGRLGRVVLPPAGVAALVEFLLPGDAKKAFKQLAFQKLDGKGAPLMLEWAPRGVFQREATGEPAAETPIVKTEQDETPSTSTTGGGEGTTLFVKNLNFDTTDELLHDYFATMGQLMYAQVAKKISKKATDGGQQVLSMGYGFVQYARAEDAAKALKELQGDMLDGHKLLLKLSRRETVSTAVAQRKETSTAKQDSASAKIIVRNVPFQATEKEIRELFSTFGSLRTVRLPRKLSASGVGAQHRGFAFVDFTTATDANRAFEALRFSTHLYGRRLVLEWARAEDESIEDVRRRTADHFAAEGETTTTLKRRKLVAAAGRER